MRSSCMAFAGTHFYDEDPVIQNDEGSAVPNGFESRKQG